MNRHKTIFRIILFPLLFSVLLAIAQFREGTALSRADQPQPTATIDRLAEPIMPANPSQADYGAKEFWFQCLPCHGDKGQGLTDEFRMLYPPEEQNCWESGCHGPRYYENGWIIPTPVPAVIGRGTLQKFPNALALQAYIKASMPYQWPGTLNDDLAWKLTAFILRENGLWQADRELGPENAEAITVSELFPTLAVPAGTPSPTPADTPAASIYALSDTPRPGFFTQFIIIGIIFGLLIGLALIHKALNRKIPEDFS